MQRRIDLANSLAHFGISSEGFKRLDEALLKSICRGDEDPLNKLTWMAGDLNIGDNKNRGSRSTTLENLCPIVCLGMITMWMDFTGSLGG